MLRGQALRSIKRLQLYRDRFPDFESYCESVFDLTMLYIERYMTAAETYFLIEEYLKTQGLNDSLPSKQEQLRPIFQAHLSPIEVGEVWVKAVGLAQGEIPSYSIVTSARHEPRVVKHRPKPFPRMRQPRSVLKAKLAI